MANNVDQELFDTYYQVDRVKDKQTGEALGHVGWSTDYSSGLANKYNLFIQIKALHLGGKNSKEIIKFKAFLTTFKEQFKVDLKAEKLVGHYEPLRKISGAERTVAVGLAIPAFSLTDARNNLERVEKFVQMMYPLAETTDASGVGQQYVRSGGDPLFAVAFNNLITYSPAKASTGGVTMGQTGYIDGLNYEFDIDQGFYVTPDNRNYPKLINLSFNFYPLNEISPHWSQKGKRYQFSHISYPYNIAVVDDPTANLIGIPSENDKLPRVAAALADNVTGGD